MSSLRRFIRNVEAYFLTLRIVFAGAKGDPAKLAELRAEVEKINSLAQSTNQDVLFATVGPRSHCVG
jgi:hypothetical protein